MSHQLGGSLRLGLLVVVFAFSGLTAGDARADLAHRIAMSLSAATGLLVLALVLVVRQPARQYAVL